MYKQFNVVNKSIGSTKTDPKALNGGLPLASLLVLGFPFSSLYHAYKLDPKPYNNESILLHH